MQSSIPINVHYETPCKVASPSTSITKTPLLNDLVAPPVSRIHMKLKDDDAPYSGEAHSRDPSACHASHLGILQSEFICTQDALARGCPILERSFGRGLSFGLSIVASPSRSASALGPSLDPTISPISFLCSVGSCKALCQCSTRNDKHIVASLIDVHSKLPRAAKHTAGHR